MRFSWNGPSRLLVCFLQSERHSFSMCPAVGGESEGVTSPLSGSLSHIRIGSRGHSLLSWENIAWKGPPEVPSAISCFGQGKLRSSVSEVPQQLRHRGVFPALQLEKEKSNRRPQTQLGQNVQSDLLNERWSDSVKISYVVIQWSWRKPDMADILHFFGLHHSFCTR